MKYNKLKAFTLAELLILLLTLSILLAAFAPVFTRRYNDASSDAVWSYIVGDDNFDAYYDAINKNYTAQGYIGLTPSDDTDAMNMVKDASDNVLYSKLVIAAGNNVKYGVSTKKQNQILFRYADSSTDKDGDAVAALYADGTNFLLGGLYDSTVSGAANTSYGINALGKLTSGIGNTAVGYDALKKLTTGSYNTAIGRDIVPNQTSNNYNTAIGYGILTNKGSYNTAIGMNVMMDSNSSANYNTIVGYNSGYSITTGYGNTSLGKNTLKNLTTGAYNVAVGNNALGGLSSGSYNTAVGFNAGNPVLPNSDTPVFTSGKYKTFIGYNSGNYISDNDSNFNSNVLYNNDYERIYIGGNPRQYVSSSDKYKPLAVLEVHNIRGNKIGNNTDYQTSISSSNTTTDTALPIPFMGNSSVVINGNLIVRGNSYFETPLRRPGNTFAATYSNGGDSTAKDYWFDAHIPKGLVLYRISTIKSTSGGNVYVFNAFDGMQRNDTATEFCGGCKYHLFKDVRQNCICTGVNAQTFEQPSSNSMGGAAPHIKSGRYNIGGQAWNNDTTYDHYEISKIINGSTSYDWASKTYMMAGDACQRQPFNGTDKIYPAKFAGHQESCEGDSFSNETGNTYSGGLTHTSGTINDSYVHNGAYYKDRSFPNAGLIYLERRSSRCDNTFTRNGNYCKEYEYGLRATDLPLAHIRLEGQTQQGATGGYNISASCCPILTNQVSSNSSSPYKDLHSASSSCNSYSDKRLKDIGDKFTAGLDEIRKINIYNYTFMTDKNKVPQVGVIAQDLKLVFPNAVSQDEQGYYKIRWDEMFYAAINSIKTLYARAEKLAVKISKDKQRVSNLRTENAELNARLDNLEKEIAKLESDRR